MRLNNLATPCTPADRSAAQPPAKGGRNSTVAPGGHDTLAGSSVVTGRSPTITEQQESTSAKRGESAWAARARLDEVGQGDRSGDLEGVGSVPAAARADAQ